jgi:hypothetical protein
MVDSRSEYNTPEYWQRLGEFVQVFAEAELETHSMLWALTNRNEKIAAAIFPERMGLDDAITSLRRLYPLRVDDKDSVTLLVRVLDQLKCISVVRNKLLHNGATFTETGVAIVEKLKEMRKGDGKVTPVPVPIDALAAMAKDCRQIAFIMFGKTVLAITSKKDIERYFGTVTWEYRSERFT